MVYVVLVCNNCLCQLGYKVSLVIELRRIRKCLYLNVCLHFVNWLKARLYFGCNILCLVYCILFTGLKNFSNILILTKIQWNRT